MERLPPAVWLTHDAIAEARLDELRWPEWPEHRDDVLRFYAGRDFTLAWMRKGRPTKSALRVVEIVERAADHGLEAEDYDAGRWSARVAALRDGATTDEEQARFDLALTVSVMRYASDLHRGRIDPHRWGLDHGPVAPAESPASDEPDEPDDSDGTAAAEARPESAPSSEPSLDLAALVEELAASSESEVEERLASLEPPHPEYQRLREALLHHRELARDGEAPVFAPLPAKVVRPGDPYPDLPALVDLLTRLGDLHPVDLRTTEQRPIDATPSEADPVETGESRATSSASMDRPSEAHGETLYEGAVVEAVERFQRRHGLEADGKIGEETLERLAMPFEERVRRIELALERWRWQPQRQASAIVINLPEFRLQAFDAAGQVAFTTEVVVGKARRHDTPVFAELMRTVVFRPGWYVPASLTSREILPELEKDPSHLEREGYQILGASGALDAAGANDVDDAETLAALRRGTLRLRQRPGPGNALGPVKFLFPNRWNVYLHATPETKGFARARRDLSHGCVRVADPIGLAEWVLRDRPDWPRERILQVIAGEEDEVMVTLDTPIPVHLVYHTVVAREDGELLFLDDLYRHDARLERALGRRRSGSQPGTPAAERSTR